MEKEQYLIYRYFIIPISIQMTIYDAEYTKEIRMKEAIQNMFSSKKTVFQYWTNRHFLFSSFEYLDRIFCFSYAKEFSRRKMIEGEYSIQEIEDLELHATQIIFDTKHQFILIQKKSSEFPYLDQVKNALSAYFSQILRQYKYTLKIDEIPDKIKFWSFISEYELINTLALKFNAPNMFFGNKDTREALNIIKKEFNIDEIDLSLKNKNNQLRIVKENISKYIDYITTVGGEYLVKARKFGHFITLKSKENVRHLFLKKDIKSDDLQDLINEMDELQNKLNEEQ